MEQYDRNRKHFLDQHQFLDAFECFAKIYFSRVLPKLQTD